MQGTSETVSPLTPHFLIFGVVEAHSSIPVFFFFFGISGESYSLTRKETSGCSVLVELTGSESAYDDVANKIQAFT